MENPRASPGSKQEPSKEGADQRSPARGAQGGSGCTGSMQELAKMELHQSQGG